ncbi:MAG: Arm DNA-binding domain-containing protein, partial [Geminicoccaceae bacterium]
MANSQDRYVIDTDAHARTADAPAKGQRDYSATKATGLYLRVAAPIATGPRKGHVNRSWVILYRVKEGPDKGKQRRFTIGRYPDMSLAAARKEATVVAGQVIQGEDPAKTRRDRRKAEAPTVKTYGEAVDEFVEKYAKPRQRSWKETERTLKVNVAVWLDRRITEITKTDAYELLDGFVAEGKHSKARLTLSWL